MASRMIEFVVKVDSASAQQRLEQIKAIVGEMPQKIPINLDQTQVSQQAKTIRDSLVQTFDAGKKAAFDAVETQRKVVASLVSVGKSGTKEFATAREELLRAKKEAEKFAEALKKADPATLSEKLQKFARSIGPTLAPLVGIGGIIGVKELIQPATELETMTARIKTLGGEAKTLANEYAKMATELASKYPVAATKIQQATYDALSAGIDPAKESIQSFTEAALKLSVAGMEGVGNSVNILSSLLNAYGASAQEASKYSDILFQTVNLGKTTVPELNQYLAQIIPTAASIGLSFENVGAALALMTANGIPTAQATTTLNALLNELLSPSEKLSPVLQKAGVSLQTLAQEGLPKTLERIKTALQETGQNVFTAFGSTEAMKAFNVLSKDVGRFTENLAQMRRATGTTQSAFEEMSSTTAMQFDQLKAIIENLLIEIGQTLLPIIKDAINTIVPPIITAINAFAKYHGIILPLIGTVGALKGAKLLLGGAFLQAGSAALASAQQIGVVTTATNLATKAVQGMKAAVLSNPFGIAIAAITTLVPLVGELVDALTTTTEETLEQARAQSELINKEKEQVQITRDNVAAKKSLVDEYISLAEKSQLSAQEQERLKALQNELAEKFPQTANSAGEFSASLETLHSISGRLDGQLNQLTNRLANLSQQAKEHTTLILGLEKEVAWEKFSEQFRHVSLLTPTLLYSETMKVLGYWMGQFRTATDEEAERIKDFLRNIAMGTTKGFEDMLKRGAKAMGVNLEVVNKYLQDISELDPSRRLAISNAIEKVITSLEAEKQAYIGVWQEKTKAETPPKVETQNNAYATILATIREFGKKYKTLSNELRQQTEKEIRDAIKINVQSQQLTEEQANTLYKHLENITKAKKEHTIKQIQENDTVLRNLKQRLEEEKDNLERSVAEQKAILTKAGLAPTLIDEQKEILQTIELYEKYKNEATKALSDVKTEEGKAKMRDFVQTLEKDIEKLQIKLIGLNAEVEAKLRELPLRKLELGIGVDTDDAEQKLKIFTDLIEQYHVQIEELKKEFAKVEIMDPLQGIGILEQISEIDKKRLQLEEKSLKLRTELKKQGATEIAEIEYMITLDELERTLKEELAKTKENEVLKFAAWKKYYFARQEAEKKYLSESTKGINILRDTLEDAAKVFAQSLTENFDPVRSTISDLETRIKNVSEYQQTNYEDEEKRLFDSLKKQEITTAEFLSRLSDLRRKKSEEDAKNSDKWTKAGLNLQLAAVKASEKIIQDMGERQKEIMGNAVAKIGKDWKGMGEDLAKFAEVTAGASVAAFGAMLAAGVEVGEAFRKGLLGTLLKTTQQAILTYIPQIYSAFLAWLGPWGIAAATGAIAVVYSALEVAKAAIGAYKEGGLVKGIGTESSDSNIARLSVGEYVVNAQSTKKNLPLLIHINKHKANATDFFIQNRDARNEIIQRFLTDDMIRKEMQQKLSQDILRFTHIAQIIATNEYFVMPEFSLEIRELKLHQQQQKVLLTQILEAIKQGNYTRKTYQNVDVKLALDDKNIVKKVEYQRYLQMRST